MDTPSCDNLAQGGDHGDDRPSKRQKISTESVLNHPISPPPTRRLTFPTISAIFEDTHGVDIPDHTLADSKVLVYKELLGRLEKSKEILEGFQGRVQDTTKKRLKQEQQEIVAVIGLLFVMDDGKFERWLKDNTPDNFFTMHGQSARRALNDCESGSFS